MRKVVTTILLCVIIGCALCMLSELTDRQQAEKEFESLKTFDLLELWEKNNDLVGWIRVDGTRVDYPVMIGDKYLHQNFEGQWSASGTPFVTDTWTFEDVNSLIYGHNMLDGSMFRTLHDFESKDFWDKNHTGTFWVICEKDGEKYVEARTFDVRNVLLTSTKAKFDWSSYTGIRLLSTLSEYWGECDANDIYDTGINTTDEAITLCTCSYHIRNDIHAGRLLVVGAKNGVTIDKDITEKGNKE